ncbi:uncharacterized protein DAT39_021393, partial [Clarias magur]
SEEERCATKRLKRQTEKNAQKAIMTPELQLLDAGPAFVFVRAFRRRPAGQLTLFLAAVQRIAPLSPSGGRGRNCTLEVKAVFSLYGVVFVFLFLFFGTKALPATRDILLFFFLFFALDVLWTVYNKSLELTCTCVRSDYPDMEILEMILLEEVLQDGDAAYKNLSLTCSSFSAIVNRTLFRQKAHCAWLDSVVNWKKTENHFNQKKKQCKMCKMLFKTCFGYYRNGKRGCLGGFYDGT